ncbi:pantoate--beta-alanine ligase [Dongia deserti]|uniref:pantoate--beta-alanine ligase n=1 Tax=Dongia deserti TaxID=2268030 RepID=UPI000E653F59|nr:pantoate--beta-alanine ligase [Dongia deserti]
MPELQIVRTVADLRVAVAHYRRSGASVGLVPTMGALHDGHLTLVRSAKLDNARVIATIFVNPKQFGPTEDLARYPRDEAADVAMLKELGTDLLFTPDVGEMYPDGFSTSILVGGLTQHLEGISRPHFFTGVATVVTKLLLQALPDRAYFGEKDFQQLQVVRRMVRDLNIPVAIVPIPTIREADGLAMSSRNRYLSPAQRKIASALPQIMHETVAELRTGLAAAPILAGAKGRLHQAGFDRVDYLELCDETTLQPVPLARTPSRVFVAAYVGATRLIDNWPVI